MILCIDMYTNDHELECFLIAIECIMTGGISEVFIFTDNDSVLLRYYSTN